LELEAYKGRVEVLERDTHKKIEKTHRDIERDRIRR